jgi:hypothetical protein
MIVYRNGDSFNVLDDDAGRVLLLNGSESEARALGADTSAPVDATVYYPSLSAILANQVGQAESALVSFQQQYQSDKLTAELAELKRQLGTVAVEVGTANKRAAWEQLKKQYNAEHERLAAVLKEQGLYDDPKLADDLIEKHLAEQPIGQQLREAIANGQVSNS